MSAKHFSFLIAAVLAIGILPSGAKGQIVSGHSTITEPHHASTEFEGAARGMGYFYRGLGAGLRDCAEGQVKLAEAQSIYLRNRYEWLKYREELRRLNIDTRTAKRSKPATTEKLAEWARAMAPAPLPSHALLDDGMIRWPAALCNAQFTSNRSAVEAALKEGGSQSSAAKRDKILLVCDMLHRQLRSRIREIPANEYVCAVKFVDSLSYEIRSGRATTPLGSVARL